jgi:hypothetical protein
MSLLGAPWDMGRSETDADAWRVQLTEAANPCTNDFTARNLLPCVWVHSFRRENRKAWRREERTSLLGFSASCSCSLIDGEACVERYSAKDHRFPYLPRREDQGTGQKEHIIGHYYSRTEGGVQFHYHPQWTHQVLAADKCNSSKAILSMDLQRMFYFISVLEL